MPYITRQDDISTLPLSQRAQNCLRRAGIHTIDKMMHCTAEELLCIRNMGAKSVEQIMDMVLELVRGTGTYILVDTPDEVPAAPAQDSGETSMTFLEDSGTVIRDMEIMDLPLSVRARNSLQGGGYRFASDLIGITWDTLIQLPNMGKKSAEEVLAYSRRISLAQKSCQPVEDAFIRTLAGELYAACGEAESLWLREILTVKAQHPEAEGDALIRHLYDSAFARGALKQKILRLLEENRRELSADSLGEHLPAHLLHSPIPGEILRELESDAAIEISGNLIRRRYPSILEFAQQIKDPRAMAFVQARLTGKTLQEIGDQNGISKERVRQIIANQGLRRKPFLREDQYADLFDRYDFSLENFTLAFDEPQETYFYLDMVSGAKKKDKKPLEEILTDTSIAPIYRKKSERAIYREYVFINGLRVKKARPDLVRHYVKAFCKQTTRYADFLTGYHLWLKDLGHGDDPALTLESRTYENILNLCDYVLWTPGKRFRYYSIPERDFEELLSALDLDQYEDTEISTLKLLRDHPALMARYDIRDEFELHNLLKKIWVSGSIPVRFGRNPTLEVGTPDLENQMLHMLLQYAPIPIDDLASRYEEAYGIKADTVKGNYLRHLDAYYYQGVYSVDFDALPTEQLRHMKAVLDRDFYTIQEVKRLYRREFPDSDESLINSYNLKALDFRVYSGYVVKNTYPSAADFFRSLLTAADIVDARTISRSIQNVVAYSSELYKLRADYEIVEFEPLQYIHINRLNAVGVTREDLRNYCADVARYCENGTWFTITSLRREGFTHQLDRLGFGEWFYASVLLEDRDHFAFQRTGGTRVFHRGSSDANLGDMLVWLLEQHRKIDFYDLTDLLEDQYGIRLPKEKLLNIIRGTGLYYDAIMEAVYIDYDTYYKEF